MITISRDIDIQPISTPHSMFRQWVVANAVGLGLGMALFAAVAEGIERSGILGAPEIGERVGHIIGLALAGAVFGLMQRRVLQRYITVSPWTLLGTAIGLMLGYILGYELGGPPLDFVLAPALAGLLGGIVQWRALRPARRAGSWPWVSMAGLLVGGAAGTAVAVAGLGDALGGSLVAWTILNGLVFGIAGAIGGAISGVLLRRLISNPGDLRRSDASAQLDAAANPREGRTHASQVTLPGTELLTMHSIHLIRWLRLGRY